MQFLLILLMGMGSSYAFGNNICSTSFSSKEAGSDQRAMAMTFVPNSTKSKINSIDFGTNPTFARMQEMHDRGEDIPPGKIFEMLVEERNYEGCACTPSLLKRAVLGFVSKLNQLMWHTFSRSITKEAMFKKSISRRLSKAKGDPEVLNTIVAQERSDFVKTLKKSVKSDLAYAKLYNRVYHLIMSARANGNSNIPAYGLIIRCDAITMQIIRNQGEMIDLELAGRAVTKDSPKAGRYAELAVQMRDLRAKRVELEERLSRLKASSWRRSTPEEKLEYELIHAWQSLAQNRNDSQIALAKFYVAKHKLRILEEALGGDLNGYQGPVDSRTIRYLTDIVEANASFFETNEKSTHNDYNPKKFIDEIKTATNPIEQFAAVKNLANYWEGLWHSRLLTIAARVEFDFAIANLSLEAGRFLLANGIRAQKDNIVNLSKKSFGLITYPVTFLRRVLTTSKAVELPANEQAKVDSVKTAFEELAQHVRAGATTRALTPKEIKDRFSIIEIYLTKLTLRREPMHQEVHDLFASTKAIDIVNWGNLERTTNVTDGQYNSVVLEKILEVQVERLARHENLGREVIENLAVWTAGAAAIYYTLPDLKWLMDWID